MGRRRSKRTRRGPFWLLLGLMVYVLVMVFGFVVDSFTQVVTGASETEYEDTYVVPAGEAYTVVDYKVKFYTTDYKKQNLGLRFKLLQEELDAAYQLLQDLDQMSDWQLGIKANYYTDPEAYFAEYAKNYYQRLYDHDSKVMDRVVALVREVSKAESLSPMDTVNLVISLIQNMRYEIPKINNFEVLSPVLALGYKYGDCDTKTLLMLITLRKLGIDCIHLESHVYTHAMLGIHVPATGDYFDYQGKAYYFVETTSPGWEIGMLPPDTNNIAYWHAVSY